MGIVPTITPLGELLAPHISARGIWAHIQIHLCVHLSFTPRQMLQCTNLIYSKKYRKRAFHLCIIQAMSHHPWGQKVEIFGIKSPTNGHCCEEHTICLVLYPMTGTKGMNGIVGI